MTEEEPSTHKTMISIVQSVDGSQGLRFSPEFLTLDGSTQREFVEMALNNLMGCVQESNMLIIYTGTGFGNQFIGIRSNLKFEALKLSEAETCLINSQKLLRNLRKKVTNDKKLTSERLQ